MSGPDPDLVAAKLVSMGRCLQRLADRCPADAATLRSDLDAQDIVSVNLERLVQLGVDAGLHLLAASGRAVPGTMREVFPALAAAGTIDPGLGDRLQRAVGFRNIAVHQYDDLDWDLVHAIATRHIGDFRDLVAALRAAAGGG